MEGTITTIYPRGYGFILSGGRRYFFPAAELLDSEFSRALTDCRVTFDVAGDIGKGPRAKSVRKVAAGEGR